MSLPYYIGFVKEKESEKLVANDMRKQEIIQRLREMNYRMLLLDIILNAE